MQQIEELLKEIGFQFEENKTYKAEYVLLTNVKPQSNGVAPHTTKHIIRYYGYDEGEHLMVAYLTKTTTVIGKPLNMDIEPMHFNSVTDLQKYISTTVSKLLNNAKDQ